MDNLTDKFLLDFVKQQTGLDYEFAITHSRKWGSEDSAIEKGTFFQLMPVKEHDPFFEWICAEYPFEQFYKTKENCTIYFCYKHKFWLEDNSAD